MGIREDIYLQFGPALIEVIVKQLREESKILQTRIATLEAEHNIVGVHSLPTDGVFAQTVLDELALIDISYLE